MAIGFVVQYVIVIHARETVLQQRYNADCFRSHQQGHYSSLLLTSPGLFQRQNRRQVHRGNDEQSFEAYDSHPENRKRKPQSQPSSSMTGKQASRYHPMSWSITDSNLIPNDLWRIPDRSSSFTEFFWNLSQRVCMCWHWSALLGRQANLIDVSAMSVWF